MDQALVQYRGESIAITFNDVKNLICPLANDKEIGIFLKICQSLQLNPFASEVYLIKYSEKDRAAIVVSIDAYLKAAETNTQFDGYESGIILDFGGKLEFREGAFLLDKERTQLVGGWAKVYRKDRQRPFYVAVNKKECLRYRKDGTLTEFWTEEKQPSMLRKVALKRALVEAFPSLFSGTVANVDVDYETTEIKEVPETKSEMQEGQLPAAFESNGDPNWRKFWAKQREKGLDQDRVHEILGVSSLKDWLAQGKTLEEADDTINKELENPLAAWDELRALIKEVKPDPKRVEEWWQKAYNLPVSITDFRFSNPPEKFGARMIKIFRDKLREIKSQQQLNLEQ